MEIIKCCPELEDIFKDKDKKIVQSNEIIVKRIKSVDVLLHIEKNRGSLTQENYVFPSKAYENEFGQIVFVEMENYSPEFETLDSMIKIFELKRKEIILNLYRLLIELRNIEVNYSDIHAKNILVNDKSFIKLIDLDGTHFFKPEEKLRKIRNQQSLIIDMIYKLYIFKDCYSLYRDYHYLMNRIMDLSEFFSYRVANFLNKALGEDKYIELLPIVLDEFEDPERRNAVQNKVKKMAPNLL